jgi:signal peptidase
MLSSKEAPCAFSLAGPEIVAEALLRGHQVKLRLAGSSMLPALWPGDELLVRGFAGESPARGELVLFVRDGWLCTHRLVGYSNLDGAVGLLTRGDAASLPDPPLIESALLGRAVAVIRDGCEIPIGSSEPTRPHRLFSFTIRRSDLFRRIALKVHAIRRLCWIN